MLHQDSAPYNIESVQGDLNPDQIIYSDSEYDESPFTEQFSETFGKGIKT